MGEFGSLLTAPWLCRASHISTLLPRVSKKLKSMETLAGKTAFITGGSTGIGLGMATSFARHGMNVVITDIRDRELTIAEQHLRQITEGVLALNVDSTDFDALTSAATTIKRSFGPLHVLCNNAGITGAQRCSTHLKNDGAGPMK